MEEWKRDMIDSVHDIVAEFSGSEKDHPDPGSEEARTAAHAAAFLRALGSSAHGTPSRTGVRSDWKEQDGPAAFLTEYGTAEGGMFCPAAAAVPGGQHIIRIPDTAFDIQMRDIGSHLFWFAVSFFVQKQNFRIRREIQINRKRSCTDEKQDY